MRLLALLLGELEIVAPRLLRQRLLDVLVRSRRGPPPSRDCSSAEPHRRELLEALRRRAARSLGRELGLAVTASSRALVDLLGDRIAGLVELLLSRS